jgi:RNA polymerase sigma-70 factor (ECF subfamily)
MSEEEKARWVALYGEFEKPLYNVVYRMLWDAGESQDIVQEAFLRCWRKRSGIRPEGQKAVLYRAAINLAINRRRQLRLWRFVGVEAVDDEAAADRTEEATIPQRMREAVDALPYAYRSVLLLTEIAGMNYSEVAGTLGISEGTVGSRRARALTRLRKTMESETSAPSGHQATIQADHGPVEPKLDDGELS